MTNELSAILKEIEFGPPDDKLKAIGKLSSMKGIPLDTVQPVLENIALKTSDDSPLKFFAIATLAILGDQRDVIVNALMSYLGGEAFENDKGELIRFPWLHNKEKDFPEGMKHMGYLLSSSTQLATLEALSHIKGNEQVANKLKEVLQVLTKEDWRTVVIYTLGAIGNSTSIPILEYYRDNRPASLDGNAARIALEHFGKADFFEIAHIHRDSKSTKSGCFIATAVYETEDAPEVWLLRRFRDEVLLMHNIGKKAVSYYYQFSPYVAMLISKSEFAKTIIRTLFLKPLICLINTRKGKESNEGKP